MYVQLNYLITFNFVCVGCAKEFCFLVKPVSHDKGELVLFRSIIGRELRKIHWTQRDQFSY